MKSTVANVVRVFMERRLSYALGVYTFKIELTKITVSGKS